MKNFNAMVKVEEKKKFSESLLWKIQREFYHEQGVSAWSEEVPFYITSNPYIANSYAYLVVRFIQAWILKNPESKKFPFYILELGAGTGQFGFYVLKSLQEYIHRLKLSDISIKYLMTDFTENNVHFWTEHGALQSFIQKGLLDFAIYDFENHPTIHLINENKILESGSLKNPLIVFANYLFDSLTSDVFKISKDSIQEALVSLSTQKNNIKNDKVIDCRKLKLSFTEQSIHSPYYTDSLFNKILFNYSSQLKDSNILFPIGGLNGIKNLQKLSNHQLFLISSDKGFVKIEELENLEYPELDFHGSFSTMVNYHAIGEYFRLQGGGFFQQTPRDGLVTAVFSEGFSLNEFPEMVLALNQSIENLSPGDFFNFYELLIETYKKVNLNILVSFLCFSMWDPFIFEEISDRIEHLALDADEDLLNYLSENIKKIADNFYFTPGCHDILFDIGVFYQTIEKYEQAITYFKLSEEYFGDDYSLFFNYGLCYFYSEQYDLAFSSFKRAETLKPKDAEIKSWLSKTKKKML